MAIGDHKTFTAQVDAWVIKSDASIDTVLKRSIFDVMDEATETVIGKMRGGAGGLVNRGKIPKDLSNLAGSLVSTLQGGMAQGGEDSYSLVIGGINAKNDPVMQFSWGGTAADYAVHVHYGTEHMDGYFWVELAAQKWKSYVEKNVEFVKRQV